MPSDITLRPLPVRFPGSTMTSRLSMSDEFSLCSACSALRDAQLNASLPQKRMRRGSDGRREVAAAARWRVQRDMRCGYRHDARAMQNIENQLNR